jgi:TRAP-type mannitol/chloroaromatic compound transport system permease large subunit
VPWFLSLLPDFKIDLLWSVSSSPSICKPPFSGLVVIAAFNLKGVSHPLILLSERYWGMMPFMVPQGVEWLMVFLFPETAL